MAADKSPFFLAHQSLTNLALVTVDDNFGPTLHFVKVFGEDMPLVEVADDQRSTVDFILLKSSKVIEASVVDVVC